MNQARVLLPEAMPEGVRLPATPPERQGPPLFLAAVGGELTVKRLARRGGRTLLVPANAAYPEFDVTDREDVCIWGVVTYAVHKL